MKYIRGAFTGTVINPVPSSYGLNSYYNANYYVQNGYSILRFTSGTGWVKF